MSSIAATYCPQCGGVFDNNAKTCPKCSVGAELLGWICPRNHLNDASNAFCVSCGLGLQAGRRLGVWQCSCGRWMQEGLNCWACTPSGINHSSAQSRRAYGDWICKACGARGVGAATTCSKCGKNLSSAAGETEFHGADRGHSTHSGDTPMNIVTRKVWECSKCKQLNSVSNSACTACGDPRTSDEVDIDAGLPPFPFPEASARAHPGRGHGADQKLGMTWWSWSCNDGPHRGIDMIEGDGPPNRRYCETCYSSNISHTFVQKVSAGLETAGRAADRQGDYRCSNCGYVSSSPGACPYCSSGRPMVRGAAADPRPGDLSVTPLHFLRKWICTNCNHMNDEAASPNSCSSCGDPRGADEPSFPVPGSSAATDPRRQGDYQCSNCGYVSSSPGACPYCSSGKPMMARRVAPAARPGDLSVTPLHFVRKWICTNCNHMNDDAASPNSCNSCGDPRGADEPSFPVPGSSAAGPASDRRRQGDYQCSNCGYVSSSPGACPYCSSGRPMVARSGAPGPAGENVAVYQCLKCFSEFKYKPSEKPTFCPTNDGGILKYIGVESSSKASRAGPGQGAKRYTYSCQRCQRSFDSPSGDLETCPADGGKLVQTGWHETPDSPSGGQHMPAAARGYKGPPLPTSSRRLDGCLFEDRRVTVSYTHLRAHETV